MSFFLSTFWHIISISPIAEGHISISQLAWRLSAFFMGQIPAMLAEHFLSARRQVGQVKKKNSSSAGKVSEVQQRPIRDLGHLGVFLWLGLTGRPFFTVYRAVGLLDTKHHIPVIRPLLAWLGTQI
jgi:hypothetical protein